MPLVDIIMTTKNRGGLLEKTLDSLFKNTDKSLYRLSVMRDGNYLNTQFIMTDAKYATRTDYVLLNQENEGLGPSLNRLTAHVKTTNEYFDGALANDKSQVSEFICYIQDDLLFTPGWLETLIKRFSLLEKQHNLGFASGLECVEHKAKKEFSGGMMLKDWIRAACMFSRRSYWESMFPIPRFDPETGRVRAKPNDGMGSGVDWWLIRNHEKSVCRTGKTCLVIPGLITHAGYKDSTWLKRELPESEADKKTIEETK